MIELVASRWFHQLQPQGAVREGGTAHRNLQALHPGPAVFSFPGSNSLDTLPNKLRLIAVAFRLQWQPSYSDAQELVELIGVSL